MKIKTKVFFIILVICGTLIQIMDLTVPTEEMYNDFLAEKYGLVKTSYLKDYTKDDLELREMARFEKFYGKFIITSQYLRLKEEVVTHPSGIYSIDTIGVFNHYFVINTYKDKNGTHEDASPVFDEVKE